MIIALYTAAAIIMAVGILYLAWRNRYCRKFLAGAFFVSSGILFYLYLADVSVPLLGTGFVETPRISGSRSIVHFILFVLCSYFGFIGSRRLPPVGKEIVPTPKGTMGGRFALGLLSLCCEYDDGRRSWRRRKPQSS